MANARYYVSVGQLAVCAVGRIGEVEQFKDVGGDTVAFGTGLDGRPWQSKVPVPIKPMAAERIRQTRVLKSEACRCEQA